MARRFLITGGTGFVGRHLAALLVDGGAEVHGTSFDGSDVAGGDRDLASVHALDVSNPDQVSRVLEEVRPDGIFHLAGVTFVPDAEARPAGTFEVNAVGAIHLLAAVGRVCPKARTVMIGSSEEYGLIGDDDLPIDESCTLRPISPYAASKAAADLIAYQYAAGGGLDVVRARPFNHTGPGQRADFVCPDFASQLVAIDDGRHPPRMQVGDLTPVRDFSDVRDVAAAYVALFEKGRSSEVYNVCSGVGVEIGAMLHALVDIVGVDVEIEVDHEKLRPSRVPVAIGSADKLRSETGWQPQFSWEQTLRSVVEDCRTRAAR